MRKIEELSFRGEDILLDIPCRSTELGKKATDMVFGRGRLGECILQDHSLLFQWEEGTIPFYCEKRELIQERLEQGYGVYAQVKQRGNGWVAQFFFFREVATVGDWGVQLTVDMKKAIAKILNQTAETLRDPNNQIRLDLEGGSFAYSLGYYTSKQEREEGFERGSTATFRIFGAQYNLLLREEEQCLRVVDVEAPSAENTAPLSLARGNLTFSKEKSILPESARRILQEREGADYIKLWDQYALAEGDLLLWKIRTVGEIRFQGLPQRRITPQGQFEYVGKLLDPSQGGLFRQVKESQGTLLLSSDYPSHLSENTSWTAYSQRKQDPVKRKRDQICDFRLSPLGDTLIMTQEKNRPLIFGQDPEEIEDKEEESTTPLPKIYVTLSLGGDAIRIKRRNQGRNRMLDGESANPRMSKVMEGKLSHPTSPREVLDPLTLDLLMEKIFPQGSTPSQREAVSIALNTPDIALIQGPPGTGKTTVITAVMEGVNQELSQDQRNAGEILITSYQHDAVDHVQKKVEINSLPPVKFQGMEGKQSPSAVELWCQQWLGRFVAKHGGVGDSLQVEKLQQKYRQYLSFPGEAQARDFLSFAYGLSKEPKNQKAIEQLLEAIESQKEDGYLLSRVRKLRCTLRGMADDGKARSNEVILALCGELPLAEAKGKARRQQAKKRFPLLFRSLQLEEEEITAEFLQDFAQEKQRLLEECLTKPRKRKAQPEITQVFQDIQREGAEYDPESGDMVEHGVLRDLLQEVTGLTPRALEKIMSKYALVYGATLQHAVAQPIAQAKLGKKPQGSGHISFDTVIVDEAARANPMDLMIAITQGRKRLILVGDHRQLPQVYDEELLERLQESTGIDLEQGRESMFQYLMTMAKKLESQDQIPRTITLQEQFRMHPVLGGFVNQYFYEKYHAQEAFTSPLPPEEFAQSLEPSPLLWLDVPLGKGAGMGRKTQTSWKREAESQAIVTRLCDYLAREDGLSYGVISFYAGQKLDIQEKIAQKQGQLPHLASLLEKVEVGTVDSFQGKEFDVIFLSLVRSQLPEEKDLDSQEKLEQWARKTYGFLTMENRLCVALSRQKKLLVVVGNGEIYGKDPQWQALVDYGVESLGGFYQLCERAGRVVSHGEV